MQARQGIKVGKCMLFFGARYKQERATMSVGSRQLLSFHCFSLFFVVFGGGGRVGASRNRRRL